MSNPGGLCKCGCGQRTNISKQTNARRGYVSGEPMDYIRGHSSFRTPVEMRGFRPLCACGCGEQVNISRSVWRRGHHRKADYPGFKTEDRGYITPCEIWQGTISYQGYPRYERGYGSVLVHRQVYIETSGTPPPGMDVHHLCEQTSCIRLDHLHLRSRADHVRAHRGVSPEKHQAILSAIRSGGESQAAIARRFGVSKSHIWRLRKDLCSD